MPLSKNAKAIVSSKNQASPKFDQVVANRQKINNGSEAAAIIYKDSVVRGFRLSNLASKDSLHVVQNGRLVARKRK